MGAKWKAYKESHDYLVDACDRALTALRKAQGDCEEVGGKDCEEAKYFDVPIAVLVAAIERARRCYAADW